MTPDPQDLTNLFNQITVWTVLQIFLIVASVYGALSVARIAAPRIAPHMPGRLRLLVLNAVPILRLVLFTLAVVWIVPLIFNVTLRNFVLVLGTVGVALGFAVKDWATSAVAGIIAVVERPYRTGDWVRIGQHYGEVVRIGTRAVQLRTADDDIVTIPHSTIWTESVVNSNDSAETLLCTADFMLSPTTPTPELMQRLKDVARTSIYVSYDRPIIVVAKNGPLATKVTLKAYPFDMRDQFAFTTDLTLRGRATLMDAGIALVYAPLMEGAGTQSPAAAGT